MAGGTKHPRRSPTNTPDGQSTPTQWNINSGYWAGPAAGGEYGSQASTPQYQFASPALSDWNTPGRSSIVGGGGTPSHWRSGGGLVGGIMSTPRRFAESIERSINTSAWGMEDGVFAGATPSRSAAAGSASAIRSPWGKSPFVNRDEEELRWAAIERLPPYQQLRTAIFRSVVETEEGGGRKRYEPREVDVRDVELRDRLQFIERIIGGASDEDNERFLKKVRARFDSVGIQLPTVEVRFEDLSVQGECHVASRALPTLLNRARDDVEAVMGIFGVYTSKTTTVGILNDVQGIIRPSRMTLLLGPPSSGKSTLLKALAGKLDPSLKSIGEVTYNGYTLDQFVPEKTAAYISQHDLHTGELTVRETLDFSASCQGIGERLELLNELVKKESSAGIHPDPEVDFFMKATAVEGTSSSLQTDYTLRILGIDVCADTIIGNEMIRGISGGQKKRVTTGEMIVGPTKTLFMDEISTGLDTSTTFQIVKCLQQIVHLGEATILMSLLQPDPETYDLFDDVILLSEGQIVYQGPREYILDFFENCGFRCPERKGVADFLQEVTSKKDQAQYWADKSRPYSYVSVSEFVACFKKFHVGVNLERDLSIPFRKKKSKKGALVFSRSSVPLGDLIKASFAKEWLLLKRNSVVYVFKAVQIVLVGSIASTVFIRSRLHSNTEADSELYIGALVFCLVVNMFNGFTELSLVIKRLPVFYKHRDILFYPPWVFTLPNVLVTIPSSIFESIVWVSITYYSIGFAPEASRFFKQMLVVFLIQQTASALFRFIAGVCRSMVVSTTWGSLSCVTLFVLGGFILPRGLIPKFWYWGYWVSPLTYAYNALVVNEMFAPRWMDKFTADGRRLGVAIFEDVNIFPDKNWYWIGAGALLGFTILFNVLFTFSLMYLNALGKKQVVSEKTAADTDDYRANIRHMKGKERNRRDVSSQSSPDEAPSISWNYPNSNYEAKKSAPKRGMVLPFIPQSMSFRDLNYYVDMPAEMKQQGVMEDQLQLLKGVTGAFRPGILTALMGVSGAGKTTLMDVLAGRKTGGYIEGEIRISGYLKNQTTFARISGYCEQNDIHSPQVTVRESLIYSAFLRLPSDAEDGEKMKFVDEVLELVELDDLKDSIVGLPGVSGLSTEQRKRLTVAVELVANPSVIFMDEPTSGLDARAAAIVMRTVRNTVDTGRTVVCTIHQPSIDIFEAFDELALMKRGGQMIYFGPLGQNSSRMIEYFEAIPGVPKFRGLKNPATWMLEASSSAVEARLGIDFAEHYEKSDLFQSNRELVEQMSHPALNSTDLYFDTMYSQPSFGQFRLCFWKHWMTYWRSPDYNYERLFFTSVTGLLLGTIFWQVAGKRDSSANLTLILGAMYVALMFVGVGNSSTALPVVAIERTVYYRERAAGMYSALSYAIAQVIVEIPYAFLQAVIYSLITYFMMGFERTMAKFIWFLYMNFFSNILFTYYGMMCVSISPNHELAMVFSGSFLSLFNLFAGFFIPKARIPTWWLWYYWICPVAWSTYGIVITQYGDIEDKITVPGQASVSVKEYLADHFGYHSDFIGVIAIVLPGFAISFALIFAYCIKKFNFQQR